jgi:putative ABC transport system permease protein
MNVYSRGFRNAFRNITRSISIIVILGLSMGLALSMLVAHQAVGDKINSVKASVGNTVTIAPEGYSGFSQVNNSLSTSQLSKVASLANISSLSEELTDRLSTTGTTLPSFGGRTTSTSSNDTTSLTSPITLNTSGGGGGHYFVQGGGGLPTNFSLPITIVGTNNPSSLDTTSIVLKSGKTISGTDANNEALISSSMASKNNLKVGSSFTAYAKTLTVAGIFSTSSTNATRATDDSVIVSLPTEQNLSGQSDAVTSATATVNSLDNLATATTAIKNTLGASADVTSSVQEANEAVQPLNSVKTISLYSVIGAVIAGGVIILLTMVMIVRERTREIGVLKAIGASNWKVVLQFMSEAVTLTFIGAIVGIILGVFAANPITKLLVNNTSTSSTVSTTRAAGFGGARGFGGGGMGAGGGFRTGGRGATGFLKDNFSNVHAAVGYSIIIYGLVAAILIAIIGSAAVSYFISRIRPAEVMRTE